MYNRCICVFCTAPPQKGVILVSVLNVSQTLAVPASGLKIPVSQLARVANALNQIKGVSAKKSGATLIIKISAPNVPDFNSKHRAVSKKIAAAIDQLNKNTGDQRLVEDEDATLAATILANLRS